MARYCAPLIGAASHGGRESYVEHLLTRDAELVDGSRDPARLRRYLEALALNTAGIVEDKTLFEAAGIDRKTAMVYQRLLVNLRVVEGLPAWTSDRLKRLVLSDTFVVAQLRAELAVAETRPRLYHVRQQQGRFEIDLLAELGGGRLVGIEVKADAAPTSASARHLARLRDQYDHAFVAGIVLHTGPRPYRLGERLIATPISTPWS